MLNIESVGVYVPLRRLERSAIRKANSWFASQPAKGTKAIAGWDEDALTMAVEASRDCLPDGGPDRIGRFLLASTTLPFSDRQSGVIAAEALDLKDNVQTLQTSGGMRAGMSALVSALHQEQTTLIAATDRRKAKSGSDEEATYGDGAAAVLLSDQPGLARIVSTSNVNADFVDHYRSSDGTFDYRWEERWIREEGYKTLVPGALDALLAEAGVERDRLARLCIPLPSARLSAALAKACGLRPDIIADPLLDDCGDTGTAHPFLLLAAALEELEPGDLCVVAAFGQGVEMILIEVTRKAPAKLAGALQRKRLEMNYNRYLALNGLLQVDRGIRAEGDRQTPLTALYRARELIHGLKGGECTSCGTKQIPLSKICVNPNCRSLDTQRPHCFTNEPAEIVSFTSDALCYTPDPPAVYGMVAFKSGGRLFMDFADADPDSLDVGAPMQMVFRIKEHDPQRGFVRYFWKATPKEPA